MLNGADLTKADLTGAFFEGASLLVARLQGASLSGAQLKGASLYNAQLQGASLIFAQLQGAFLNEAQLQGARLDGARLQGAALNLARLQGASLEHAQLQGASLVFAQLQGADLGATQLQGASLVGAQLQGALLSGAKINAADFSFAFLWRTDWGTTEFGAVRVDAALELWKSVRRKNEFEPDPVPWDAKAYAELRDSMNTIPEGKMRDEALWRIARLDCGNPDKALASCDPAAAPPPEVLDWQNKLREANVDDAAFAKVLVTELRSLACANDADAIHILHGILRYSDRLSGTGREAPALVDFIMSRDCPVSAALTDDDKAVLLEIKQDAEKKFGPPPTAKKEN